MRSLSYRKIAVLIPVVFIYVVWTSVLPEWMECIRLVSTLVEAKSKELSPEEVSASVAALEVRKAQLNRRLTGVETAYDRTVTGLVEFIDASGRKANTPFQSLIPAEPRVDGGILAVSFKIALSSTFHRIGLLVNELESGPFTISITHLSLETSSSSGVVTMEVEGTAFMVAGSASL